METESPSQPSPAVIQRMWTSSTAGVCTAARLNGTVSAMGRPSFGLWMRAMVTAIRGAAGGRAEAPRRRLKKSCQRRSAGRRWRRMGARGPLGRSSPCLSAAPRAPWCRKPEQSLGPLGEPGSASAGWGRSRAGGLMFVGSTSPGIGWMCTATSGESGGDPRGQGLERWCARSGEAVSPSRRAEARAFELALARRSRGRPGLHVNAARSCGAHRPTAKTERLDARIMARFASRCGARARQVSMRARLAERSARDADRRMIA